MFGFFKREASPRGSLRKEFESVTGKLRQADLAVQLAVGHAINITFDLFRRSYTVDAFQALSSKEQLNYLAQLSALEKKLVKQEDFHSALGTALFKMWLGAVSAKDAALEEEIRLGLSHFSKQGDFFGRSSCSATNNADPIPEKAPSAAVPRPAFVKPQVTQSWTSTFSEGRQSSTKPLEPSKPPKTNPRKALEEFDAWYKSLGPRDPARDSDEDENR